MKYYRTITNIEKKVKAYFLGFLFMGEKYVIKWNNRKV